MPYIKEEDRKALLDKDSLKNVFIQNPGQLNYLITELCLHYLETWREMFDTGKLSYNDFNAVIGALECAKLEMYRRMIAPYEDKKKEENGDVYPV